jgi:predicted signal transduction protein with EAL and GGDEF domain
MISGTSCGRRTSGRDFLVSIKPVLVASFLVLLGCVGAFLAFWRRNEKTRQEHERHIHYLAHVDSLTGLLNRPSLERELDDTLSVFHEEVARGAVIYLDLDSFKAINDTLGHAAGDQGCARGRSGFLAEKGSRRVPCWRR